MTEQETNLWLVQEGTAFNARVSDNLSSLSGQYQPSEFFNMAIAEALTWTGHVIGQPPGPYYRHALAYLSGSDAHLGSAAESCGRYGADALKNALHGWRVISNETSHVAARTCTARELVDLQARALDAAVKLSKRGEIHGVGAWLFCGPYKVAALCRRELWENAALDDLWMPIGLEVARGVELLKRRRHSLFKDIGDVMQGDEGGLADGMGDVVALQNTCRVVVADAGGRVIHVNSGIFKLGQDGSLP